jgi:hypothetical protein
MQIFFFVATGEGKEEMMTEIFQESPSGSLHKATALHMGSSFGLLISCHNQSLKK